MLVEWYVCMYVVRERLEQCDEALVDVEECSLLGEVVGVDGPIAIGDVGLKQVIIIQ